MNKIYYIILLLLFSLMSCKNNKQPDIGVERRLQNKIDSIYSLNPESVGILVHVEYPKESLSWSGAIGYANRESKSIININQPVLIASNTKTFVSATILRLVEEEKIDLNTSIDYYLSDKTRNLMSNAGYDLKRTKVKHLLSHTSGINDYVDSSEFEKKFETEPKYQWTRNQQIELAILQMEKIGEPGFQYKYSDTNYLLLTEIIEQITEVEFYKAIKQLLNFTKNDIESTWFEGLEKAPSGTLPIAHQYIGKWNLDIYDIDKSFDLFGGGGLASTTKDLSLFIHKTFNGEIFKNIETINLLLTKVETEMPSDDDYRFGIWKSKLNGETVYGHGGFWGTMVYHLPELNATISIAILNKDNSSLRKEIAKTVMNEFVK